MELKPYLRSILQKQFYDLGPSLEACEVQQRPPHTVTRVHVTSVMNVHEDSDLVPAPDVGDNFVYILRREKNIH